MHVSHTTFGLYCTCCCSLRPGRFTAYHVRRPEAGCILHAGCTHAYTEARKGQKSTACTLHFYGFRYSQSYMLHQVAAGCRRVGIATRVVLSIFSLWRGLDVVNRDVQSGGQVHQNAPEWPVTSSGLHSHHVIMKRMCCVNITGVPWQPFKQHPDEHE